MLRLLQCAVVLSLWAALGLVVGLTAITSLATPLGYRAYNVLSGSMEPTLAVGGLVVNKMIDVADARPGDVVTFRDPAVAGRLITHRVRSVELRGGRAHVMTQGDANDAPERWDARLDGQMGRVAYHVPWLGYARIWIAGPWGRVALIAGVLAWGALALWDVWRPAGLRDQEMPASSSHGGTSS